MTAFDRLESAIHRVDGGGRRSSEELAQRLVVGHPLQPSWSEADPQLPALVEEARAERRPLWAFPGERLDDALRRLGAELCAPCAVCGVDRPLSGTTCLIRGEHPVRPEGAVALVCAGQTRWVRLDPERSSP